MFRLVPFRPTRDGKIKGSLRPDEVDLLKGLPSLLRPVIESDLDDPGTKRLFPEASRDDPAVAAAFRSMVHDDLVRQRLGAIDKFESTLDGAGIRGWSRKLEVDEAEAWLSVMNSARLVLGTRLPVSDENPLPEFEPSDPNWAPSLLYGLLGELESYIVQALSVAEGRGVIDISPADFDE